MLWFLNSAGVQTAYLPEAESVVVTRKHNTHSEFAAKIPLSRFADASKAYFVIVQGLEPVFLVEHVEIVKGEYVDVRGREVSALPHTRALEGTFTWANVAPGQMVKDILDSFTGTRAIPLAFGTGETLGTATSLQRSWKDAGEAILEIVAAAGLGMRTRMVGTTPTLDLYEPSTTAVLLGDKHGTGSSATHVKSIGSWKTYAIVLGQGQGDDRTRVDVDLTGGTLERRELVVDAKDISPDGLTAEQYEAALAERGTAKLEETCKVEYGEATVDTALEPGALVYYDAGLWADELLVTEAQEIREGGKKRYSATLGWREPSVWQTVARVSQGAVNIDGGNVHVVGATGEPAFTNSWTNYGSGYVAAGFVRETGGWVSLMGMVAAGTSGAAAFTLPEGFRPAGHVSRIGAGYGGYAAIVVSSAGVVTVTVAGGASSYASLEGIRFLAA